jgi:hypothetical protein
MHFDTSPAHYSTGSAEALTEEDLAAAFDGPDLISDDEIDYAAIARRTQPDQPGGQIVFDSADESGATEVPPREWCFVPTRVRPPSASCQPLRTYGEITFTPNTPRADVE